MLGPPGSGKGTQARLVAERFEIPHLSSGEILRALRPRDDAELDLLRAIDAGAFAPDAMILPIIERRLVEADCSRGYVLDGFPRTLFQAEALDDRLRQWRHRISFAFYLDVPREVLRRRLVDRGRVSGRMDDMAEAVDKRLKLDADTSAPLIGHYQRSGSMFLVNGSQPPELVFASVLSHIESHPGRSGGDDCFGDPVGT